MDYSIRYNRSTNHIAGIGAKTTGGGTEVGGEVTYYAQNACGTLTRSNLAQGKGFESLADALAAARIAGGRNLCKNCERAALAQIAAESATLLDSTTNDKGEGTTMAAKTATATADHDKTREEIAALIERLTAVAIAGEDTAALKEEAENLIKTLPTADRTKLRSQVRQAAESKPAPAPVEGTVVKASERAADTQSWEEIDGARELLDNAAGKFVSGTKLHLKTADTAGEIARLILDLRSRASHKGKPDMLARGAAARTFKRDIMAEAVRVYMTQNPDADRDEVELAGTKMETAIDNALRNELVYWARGLTDKSEGAERFAFALESAPEGTTLAEAVRAEYGIATESPAEKMKAKARADRELREAAKARAELTTGADDSEGDDESGGGEGSASAPEVAKEVAQLDKIVKSGDVIAEQSKPEKLAAKELETLESIKSRLEAEASRLIRLAGRYAEEIARRAEEENV